MNAKLSRRTIILAVALLIGALLAFTFWPRAVMIDFGEASRGPMTVTVNEEGRTQVRDIYVVSAPIAGRLLRIDGEAGDDVEGQLTVVARMSPSDPSFLDARALTQAQADVRSAEAALALARAEVRRAEAQYEYATSELTRTEQLLARDAVSQAALDRARMEQRTSLAALETARATVLVREAELANARARLIDPAHGLDAQEAALANGDGGSDGEAGLGDVILIRAPITGKILRILQESETVIAAGAPILEVGDPLGDLEIVAELLSTDAVRVEPGAPVFIERWGGPHALEGFVERVEPFGFTKISALGVEEQRVRVIIRFANDEHAGHGRLGHGFRVETRIVVWQADDALRAPASALFRDGDRWAVFRVENGRARRTFVEVGQNNGREAEILNGLADGDLLVLYPSDQISDGVKVAPREA